MDLTGITNQNEYYTNHYFASIFEENASGTISSWRTAAKDSEEFKTPWALLRDTAKQYYPLHDRYLRSKFDTQVLVNIRVLADGYLKALGYPKAKPEWIEIDNTLKVPVYLEIKKANGAPALWVLLAASEDKDAGVLNKFCFSTVDIGEEGLNPISSSTLTTLENEDLATKILFGSVEPPRFLVFIGMNQIALIDRNKWNEKRYLQFELEEIFSRREESTLQAMAVLLHINSLCPEEGTALLDELDANSQKHAAGVSQDLKFALRESIELLGNEVLYDMTYRLGRNLDTDPVDAGQLTLQCLRYMYRMLFVLFIESRPELGYAPIKAQSYLSGYSLESLRDIADNIRDDVNEVGSGYYLHETLSKLYELIYSGYPKTEEDIIKYSGEESLHDMFVIAPLKAHIFDPEYTKMITEAKLRNCVMLRIIDLMSLTRNNGRRNGRRGRISYANLGINQMGSVYEALLSYRGFIAEHTLFEVKRAGDSFNELDVGYFVSEQELDQYTDDERVRYEQGENKGKLRRYEKGSFIYRLAGREREKSASYYTPEVLTKCLVKYALKELLEGKTADEILNLTVCEPAMGSAAFLNETISQLAEAYIDKKQKELGEIISYEDRFTELQKVKMFIADRNVYGIDLNPVAVELAEVSLWLNTIFGGDFVPWFGTQLVCGNSLIGARRQCYRVEYLTATAKGMHWYENAPDRVPLSTKRQARKQVYHFLLGDLGMADYTDKIIKSLDPDNIKQMVQWNKRFNSSYNSEDLVTLLRLSAAIDDLWEAQINLRKQINKKTKNTLSIYGYEDDSTDSHTTIREKDKILNELYKSEHMKNAGPYARLKFAMDYWCALWFWPIDKADLLPTRSEFFFDMSLILEGTMASVNVRNDVKGGQLSMFPTEMEQLALDIVGTYGTNTVVDIPSLRSANPRLNLAYEIAVQNHFMHWELEFAELFAERGGFDLIIGNPPWIKVTWEEKGVLSDKQPLFAVRDLSATQTAKRRDDVLKDATIKSLYFSEYESMSGQQAFLNSIQNYEDLRGQQTNLYKCFLPIAWMAGKSNAIIAFLHPDSIYDDPKGGSLRKTIYGKLRGHFQFINEKLLFPEVGHPTIFGINIYSNKNTPDFVSISNLFDPSTIDECFDDRHGSETVEGIKDNEGNWNIHGNASRILLIGIDELRLFSKVFDSVEDPKTTRLPSLHSSQLLSICKKLSLSQQLVDFGDLLSTSQMLNETGAQEDGTMDRHTFFPKSVANMVYSGPHIWTANPVYKTPRRICKEKADYDVIDICSLPETYIQRTNYEIKLSAEDLRKRLPNDSQAKPYIDSYRLAFRRRLNVKQERTLIGAIIPPKTLHTNLLNSLSFLDDHKTVLLSGMAASLPFDFLIKSLGKGDLYDDSIRKLPYAETKYDTSICARALMLNCLTDNYRQIWKSVFRSSFINDSFAKQDNRLNSEKYKCLVPEWHKSNMLTSDYERYHALIELDVLTSMAFNLSIEELKVMYRIQFPVLQAYQEDTWFDANGRIAFTNNRGLSGVGVDRAYFENEMKYASVGQKFHHIVTDDTMPGGPIERTIEYVAPFDRCDREQDYETAWKFFEEKYEENQ